MRRLTGGALALLYGWNDTVAHDEASMPSELDFYLAQIDLAAGNRPLEQARFQAGGVALWALFLLLAGAALERRGTGARE